MRMRWAAPIVAVATLAFPTLPASASPCGGIEVVSLTTFHLDIAPAKPVYEVGQTAVFNVTITRPAHEDPAGQGIEVPPPRSFPAADVPVGIGLVVEDVYLWGLGRTDAAGKTSIKVPLRSYTPAGVAQARAFAQKTVVDSPCLTVNEIGYRPMPDAFRVTD